MNWNYKNKKKRIDSTERMQSFEISKLNKWILIYNNLIKVTMCVYQKKLLYIKLILLTFQQYMINFKAVKFSTKFHTYDRLYCDWIAETLNKTIQTRIQNC
jgi:hypothetical protein